jgi:MoxR-like ATPase
VQDAISVDEAAPGDHPRAHLSGEPDPEVLARDLEALSASWQDLNAGAAKDQLSALAARLPWVKSATAREALEERVAALWSRCAAA